MKLTFKFEEPLMPWHVLGCARLMCDIQHLCLFGLFLGGEAVSNEFDFFSDYAQKYEAMIMADLPFERGRLDLYAVRLTKFNFNSPPEIDAEFDHDPRRRGRIRAVFDSLRRLLTSEAQSNKLDAEAGLIRERRRGELLKNIKQAVGIAKEIEKLPPQLREVFIENLASALRPFDDGRHPKLKDLRLPPPEDDKESPP